MAKYDVGIARHGKKCSCGGDPVVWTDTGTPDFFIECSECGEDGPWANSVFSAIQAWNNGERVADDDDVRQ